MFKVGQRVRCTNDSIFRGLTGTVSNVRLDDEICEIEWDLGPQGSMGNGGFWDDNTLEILYNNNKESNMIKTLIECRKLFKKYAENHRDKPISADTLEKAVTNMRMVEKINDVIRAN